jgi:hypothetical protein
MLPFSPRTRRRRPRVDQHRYTFPIVREMPPGSIPSSAVPQTSDGAE